MKVFLKEAVVIGTIIFIGGVAYKVVFRNIKNMGNKISGKLKGTEESAEANDMSQEYEYEVEPVELEEAAQGQQSPKEPKPKKAPQDPRAEFMANAKQYVGNYQPLYDSLEVDSPEKRKKVIKNWENRLKRYAEQPLQNEWNRLKVEAFGVAWFNNVDSPADKGLERIIVKWYKKLEGWGVRKGETGEILIDNENMEERYDIDRAYQVGDKLHVEMPYWYIKQGDAEVILEKGSAAVVDQNEVSK